MFPSRRARLHHHTERHAAACRFCCAAGRVFEIQWGTFAALHRVLFVSVCAFRARLATRPSHRDAVTYAPGQRDQPCKTVCVVCLTGRWREIAVRRRSELKARTSGAGGAGVPRSGAAPLRGPEHPRRATSRHTGTWYRTSLRAHRQRRVSGATGSACGILRRRCGIFPCSNRQFSAPDRTPLCDNETVRWNRKGFSCEPPKPCGAVSP